MVHKHTSRREKSFRGPRLPDDLTQLLFEKIKALPSSVKTDYLKSEIDSKFVSKDTDSPELRRSRALEKWLSVELDNEKTEERLINTPSDFLILRGVTFDRFVGWCQRFIVDIIGESPPPEALHGSFSGGASTSRGRTQSHPAFKYVGVAHATPGAMDWLPLLRELHPLWLGDRKVVEQTFSIFPGNVFFTVPKKTDIDRVACKEPDLNMFIQKGIGAFIRRRLRLAGINLNDQSINRSLAQLGSQTGRLATLDLSSASDTVTREIVFQFLPVTWYTLLDSVRSHVTMIDGEEHRNWMFSSMGNGFTFELESLLFFTIVKAVSYFTGTPGIVSVYGDDIICPSEIAETVSWVLSYFGFKVNTEKSHITGPFRESCGGHYHYGIDITPFYVKEPVDSLDKLIHVANKLRKWAADGPDPHPRWVLDLEVESIWLWLKDMVPKHLWGGSDFDSKFQLVSYDTPRNYLQPERARARSTEDVEGYLLWHNSACDRSSSFDERSLMAMSLKRDQDHNRCYAIRDREHPYVPISTSSNVRTLDTFRLRKVRAPVKPLLPQLFLHEIVGEPVKLDM